MFASYFPCQSDHLVSTHHSTGTEWGIVAGDNAQPCNDLSNVVRRAEARAIESEDRS